MLMNVFLQTQSVGRMEDSTNWVLELEEALLDEAPPQHIKVLLAGLIDFLK